MASIYLPPSQCRCAHSHLPIPAEVNSPPTHFATPIGAVKPIEWSHAIRLKAGIGRGGVDELDAGHEDVIGAAWSGGEVAVTRPGSREGIDESRAIQE